LVALILLNFRINVISPAFQTAQNLLYNKVHMAKVVPNKPLFIMLYGFPGSGKSYFARQLCENIQAAHVSGDRFRAELFDNPSYTTQEDNIITQLMSYMSEEFLNAGLSVVYDANALRATQRHALREIARKAHAQPILVWLQIDTESAYLRGSQRDRRRADDRYSAPMDRSMFDQAVGHMQNPSNTEDYVVISGKHLFTTQFSAVVKRLRELGLIGIDDSSQRIVKPGMVNLVPNPAAGRVDMTRRNIVIR
jgi:predicted kinase